ncbi:MAG: Abi family protein, partial [Clostridia bacterium]|nr:Abi family protein [Clostridia bacterium]
MPIWVFVELISFGDLEELIGYYASKTGWNIPVDMKSISRVRQI